MKHQLQTTSLKRGTNKAHENHLQIKELGACGEKKTITDDFTNFVTSKQQMLLSK